MPLMQYPDISRYQIGLRLDQLQAGGYDTVCLRASAGDTYHDDAFPAWWGEAGARGMRRLAYHFLYEHDAAREAGNFLDAINRAGGFRAGDAAMSDMETLGDPNPVSGCARSISWHEIVHAWAPSVRQVGYGNAWYLQDGGYLPSRLPNVGIVIAAYPAYIPNDSARPALPRGWDHACGWQFSDNIRVPGWGAGVDMNRITCPSNFAHLGGAIGPDVAALLPGSAWPVISPSSGSPTQIGVMRRLLTHAGFPDADDGRPLDLLDADRVGKLQAAHGLVRDGLFGPQSLYAALSIHQSSATASAWPTMTPVNCVTHPYHLGAQRTLLNRVGMWDKDDGRRYGPEDLGATAQYQRIVNSFAGRQVINPTGVCDAVTLTYLLGCKP